MFNEIKSTGLKKTDRIFKKGNTYIKVRLLAKEIHEKNKMSGPGAISFQLTASVCGKDGKALPDKDGRFAILPHTLTLPLMELGQTEKQVEEKLEEALNSLIDKTLSWHKTRKAAEKAFKAWENS